MRRYHCYTLLSILIFFRMLPALAQDNGRQDTVRTDRVRKDSAHVAETLLLEQQREEQLDSLLKLQLRTQLRQAAGNQVRARELQSQLDELATVDSAKRALALQRVEILKKNAQGFPVVLDNDTLFLLYTKVGSFVAGERAAAISARIGKLYKDYSFSPDSLKILTTENGYDIVYKNDPPVMSVPQLDALGFHARGDSPFWRLSLLSLASTSSSAGQPGLSERTRENSLMC